MIKTRLIYLSVVVSLMPFVSYQVFASSSSPFAERAEAIVIEGKCLPINMINHPIPDFRLFVYNGSTIEAIPFQIDERDVDGKYLVEEGPQGCKGDGAFNLQDELVFMARDVGTNLGPKTPSVCEQAVIISLVDINRHITGYVLLALCENPPPLSSKDYVQIDINNRTIRALSYGFGWREAPVYYYDYLTIGGGNDLLDRIKVRCSIGKWGMTYTFSEEDFHTSFVGYTDGPVRVVWRSENYWSLGAFGRIPSPQSICFYPDYIVDRNDLDMTINPAVLGLDFNLKIGHDMALANPGDAKLCANILPDCLPISEDVARLFGSMGKGEIQWGGIALPGGAMITRLVKDPRLMAPVKYVFEYDPSHEDPEEYIKGSSPMLGFEFAEWKDVKPEVYDLTLYHFIWDEYSADELARFNKIIDEPLKIGIKEE